MKIGLFFGSFNPIHVGHLIIAEHIIEHTELQQIWFVVSPQNPFKAQKSLLSEYNRLHLVHLAIQNNDHFKASDIEFALPKPSYTIDTLVYLKEKHPNHTFSLIMGSDNLENIHKWKNADILIRDYAFYIYNRPQHMNYNHIQLKDVTFLDAPQLNISSTYIRNQIKQNKSVQYILTDDVRKEIEDLGYYK